MTLSAVLIDDEKNNLNNLLNLIQSNCPEIEVCATARDAQEGKRIIIKYNPQVVFLDINMPGTSGFDLLRSLDNYDFEVIFVTAYENFAIQAIKFAAVDYLLKPVDINELKTAVKRAAARRMASFGNLKLENLIELLKLKNEKKNHRIALVTLKETRFIATQDIIRCEASNNYTSFFLEGNEKIIVSRPIYSYEEILTDYGFIRCHQSHLVNVDYVKSWVKTEGEYLLLHNGNQIPISRGKRNIVSNALKGSSKKPI
jgi:two-component system, LytTR family, response regulator